jgi:hypothetical protein
MRSCRSRGANCLPGRPHSARGPAPWRRSISSRFTTAPIATPFERGFETGRAGARRSARLRWPRQSQCGRSRRARPSGRARAEEAPASRRSGSEGRTARAEK